MRWSLSVLCLLVALAAVAVGTGSFRAHRHGHGHGHKKSKHFVDRRPPDLSRYHSSEQLIQKFHDLQATCPYLSVGSRRGEAKELVTVSLSKPSADKERLKVLLFFGEHARELISPETALRFTQMLCGHTPDGHSDPDLEAMRRINRLLDASDILLFPLINADGHRRVVRGSYCTRTNRAGVDLNRNWDDHWKFSSKKSTFSGRKAFSEDEVRILRDAATEFRPDLFVSIHSGALGMYTPYAYSTARPSGPLEESMVRILKGLNPRYCNCDVGAAGKELNYLCPGTCLDYMFDKLKTPYAFAVEIWDGSYGFKKEPSTPRSSFLEHSSRAGVKRSVARAHAKTMAQTGAAQATVAASKHHEAVSAQHAHDLNLGSCFLRDAHSEAREAVQHHSDVAIAHKIESESHAEFESDAESHALFPAPRNTEDHSCLAMFNPTNPKDYVATTDSWSHMLVDLVSHVLDHDERAPKE